MEELEYRARADAIVREEVEAMVDRVAKRAVKLIAEKICADICDQLIKEHPEWRAH